MGSGGTGGLRRLIRMHQQRLAGPAGVRIVGCPRAHAASGYPAEALDNACTKTEREIDEKILTRNAYYRQCKVRKFPAPDATIPRLRENPDPPLPNGRNRILPSA